MDALPLFISVDDHVVEPPDLWWSRLPTKLREQGPHVRRERGVLVDPLRGRWSPTEDGTWADVWYYEDLVKPFQRGSAQSGFEEDDHTRPVTFEDVLPGTYQRDARMEEMARNHTEVSICFPTVSRFCGQMFLDRKDPELALLCIQAYNDWMIQEWCGTERPARLAPMTLVPLWDPELAAEEVRRCAANGSHAISFPECPPTLGLPSIFSQRWDSLFAACEETDTVLNLHVGSAPTMTTAPDAPSDESICFFFINSQLAFTDWLYSGVLEDFPELKLVLSEGQVGWMPFLLQRIDNTWKKVTRRHFGSGRRAKQLPSSSMPGRVFGAIFDDVQGLIDRAPLGIEHIMIETDFPHSDSTYPDSEKLVSEMVVAAGLNQQEINLLLRGNAIRVYGLDKYFGITA